MKMFHAAMGLALAPLLLLAQPVDAGRGVTNTAANRLAIEL
jgi:hypothetical protein